MFSRRTIRRPRFNMNLQSLLIVGFLTAACFTGLVATAVGMHLINKNTIGEVHRTIEHNINAARLIYEHDLDRLLFQLRLAALRLQMCNGGQILLPENPCEVQQIIGESDTDHAPPDMLFIVDREGRVTRGISNPELTAGDVTADPLVQRCLETGLHQSATILMPVEQVLSENPLLVDRVDIPVIETPQSAPLQKERLTEALVARAVVPLKDLDGTVVGAVVGGILLNNDFQIVDRIVRAIYGNEQYRGLEVGFATIFQGGVRISTNVTTEEGTRAVGTTVSEEVYRTVIEKGEAWIGRAFVVNDWYISAYLPIRSPGGDVIGMLYTGVLEATYTDMKRSSMLIFLAVTFLGVVGAFFVSWRFGRTIIERVRILKDATDAIASGNLDYKVRHRALSGLDMLDDAFNNMTKSLKDRDERLKKVFQQLTKSERLAALGQIAAGVAHEINNPLGGIILYSNLVLEDLPEENEIQRKNVEKIIYQANRCKQIVQNLLDFSRSPSGEMMPLEINRVILTSLGLVKDQSMFLGINVETNLADDLPEVMGDQSRLEQVFLNIFVNSVDAMQGKGTLTIKTKLLQRYHHGDRSVDDMETEKVCLLTSTNTVKITITDTGPGIDESYLPHIFEPFFSTKEPGKGTGLGLSITYSIIKKHDGFIDVESRPGEGTAITIYLPARDVIFPGALQPQDIENGDIDCAGIVERNN
ncbi:MAG: hypothetical protein AVO39_05510 [delta proteobacterium MLS_D]|jgi:two-component system, NtrC family, sensor kinase|nr:MAG: hypothetical protein AVO39_05510 [delta proteobacterium MLS_D]